MEAVAEYRASPDRSDENGRGLSLTLPRRPSSVARARGHVRAAFGGLGLLHLIETAVLLTSELATNAVRHAHAGRTFEITVRSVADHVWVEVADQDGSPLPSTRAARLDDTGGRGLHLLDCLADRWEAESNGTGKIVRFGLSLARPS
ncbi:ATP-binding protein [Kitasatospora atroaurantiaca]|nr:ATP-binding protein [Kitasatospora atroaurantiaca]